MNIIQMDLEAFDSVLFSKFPELMKEIEKEHPAVQTKLREISLKFLNPGGGLHQVIDEAINGSIIPIKSYDSFTIPTYNFSEALAQEMKEYPNHRVINIVKEDDQLTYRVFIEIDKTGWPIPCGGATAHEIIG